MIVYKWLVYVSSCDLDLYIIIVVVDEMLSVSMHMTLVLYSRKYFERKRAEQCVFNNNNNIDSLHPYINWLKGKTFFQCHSSLLYIPNIYFYLYFAYIPRLVLQHWTPVFRTDGWAWT